MDRTFFEPLALEVAEKLLGAHLTVFSKDGPVTVRITEVEAYHGLGTPPPYDPGSHARDRETPRNSAMFGPPGHAYVYQNYGMHYAINLVCAPDEVASGVLLRSGQVIEGAGLAQQRRNEKLLRYGHNSKNIPAEKLAQGPGNLANVLNVTPATHNHLDLFDFPFQIELDPVPTTKIARGPRVGVSGEAGGSKFPWRFWIAGDKSVSQFRPGRGAQEFIDLP